MRYYLLRSNSASPLAEHAPARSWAYPDYPFCACPQIVIEASPVGLRRLQNVRGASDRGSEQRAPHVDASRPARSRLSQLPPTWSCQTPQTRHGQGEARSSGCCSRPAVTSENPAQAEFWAARRRQADCVAGARRRRRAGCCRDELRRMPDCDLVCRRSRRDSCLDVADDACLSAEAQ